jgi:hypothetical protein
MSRLTQPSWLPALLFRLTVTTAGLLALLVLLAPLAARVFSGPSMAARVIAVFAQDATLRRTALASSLGLAVTAGVFFRQPSKPWPPTPPRAPKEKRPPDVVGA